MAPNKTQQTNAKTCGGWETLWWQLQSHTTLYFFTWETLCSWITLCSFLSGLIVDFPAGGFRHCWGMKCAVSSQHWVVLLLQSKVPLFYNRRAKKIFPMKRPILLVGEEKYVLFIHLLPMSSHIFQTLMIFEADVLSLFFSVAIKCSDIHSTYSY